MEINLGDILIQMLKVFWQFKGILLIIGGILLLASIFKILEYFLNRNSKSKRFRGKKTIHDLQYLTPSQFENYIEELFRALGYKTKTVGGVGDGGIDVEVEKDGLVHYIQCKKFIIRQVPVGAVRDFYGAIADKVDGGKGYFITTNVFTLEAEKFAEGKPIELVDRFKLMEYVKLANIEPPTPERNAESTACPQCGGTLIERKGKFGRFMGCSNYPKCKYTLDL
jgi:restriction system protein